MQTIGYMNLRGTGKGYKETVLVLCRKGKDCRYFSIRKSGKKGVHFSDEEMYLNDEFNDNDFYDSKILKLLDGNTICL